MRAPAGHRWSASAAGVVLLIVRSRLAGLLHGIGVLGAYSAQQKSGIASAQAAQTTTGMMIESAIANRLSRWP